MKKTLLENGNIYIWLKANDSKLPSKIQDQIDNIITNRIVFDFPNHYVKELATGLIEDDYLKKKITIRITLNSI